ncbi:Sel1 repeat-containing protein [Pseudidiomarina planktonica]|uniref:Sel1 repeat-containing protein n=1 Tax=Pseudidiomarina planktonica TaxID=1323738 RepID=A0A1Y6G2E0_9GAMM|nr:tetratricopeptide repeat protein [Pseudidiomarina planktonica]RUO62939.1 sel1 repeat family protein [Pseudidiomarina planktonica]SMQ80835.1 Sel1 repeat-containing protein [Pseudidiomarina planktonica]
MSRGISFSAILLALAVLQPSVSYAQDLEAVQLYTDADLIAMFRENTHLNRVSAVDRCQLVQDIKAQAEIEKRPTYQFLYGDMLAWNVCYERNEELGVRYMEIAAEQGLPEALEQLGRYYHEGVLVQKDVERAILYLREASSLGNLPAQLRLADILIAGEGSPYDLEKAYQWLYQAVTADSANYQAIRTRLSAMAELMPARVVERARRPLG